MVAGLRRHSSRSPVTLLTSRLRSGCLEVRTAFVGLDTPTTLSKKSWRRVALLPKELACIASKHDVGW